MTWPNNYFLKISDTAYAAYDKSKSFISKNPLKSAAFGTLGIVTMGPGGVFTTFLALGILGKGAYAAWEGLKQHTIKEPHHALLALKSLLNEIIEKPNAMTPDKIRKLHAHLSLLSIDGDAVLKELAPQLQDYKPTLQMIEELAENQDLDFVWELLEELREATAIQQLQNLAQFIDICIIDQTGYLPTLKEKAKHLTIQNVIKQPPKELRPLQLLLSKYLNNQNERTLENVRTLYGHLTTLLNNDHQLLIEIAPDLSNKQLQICNSTFEMIENFENDESLDVNLLNSEETLQCIYEFTQFFNDCMNNQKGLIVQLFDRVDPTAAQVKPINNEQGFFSQVGQVVQEELTQRHVTKETVTNFAAEKFSATAGSGYKLVKDGLGSLFGKPTARQPADGPKVEDVTNKPEASAEEGTISQFLSYGSSYLKGLMGNGGGIISKLTISTFASWFASGLNLFLQKMKDSGISGQPIETLEEILVALVEVEKNGNYSTLAAQIEKAAKMLKSNGIITSIHGFPIPLIGATSEKSEVVETSYSDNIMLLKEAIDAPLPPPQNQNWEGLAIEENKKLVYNISNFLALKHIYEEVCKLKPDYETFYLNLIAEATKNGATSTSKLKELLLNKLKEKNVGYLRLVWAGWKFSGFRLLTKKYTAKAVTVYFKEIFKYISENKSDDFNTLRKLMMANFTGYLTTLGGAYDSISKNPHPTGTMEKMLHKELDKKESNLGFEPLELYKELAKSVLAKMTGEGIFSWIAWQLTKLFLDDPAQIVKEIVEASTTMQDVRGYSHALNTVIREELDEIWNLLRADHLNPQNGQASETPTDISEGKKKQLSALIKNLFEILGKSKCDTLDELRRLLAEKDMTAKFNQTIDGFYIKDVIEKISTILAVTIESLAKEDQLQKLTYKFSSLLNQSFEVGNVVTLEQMQDEERKIAKRSEQILLYAVNSAIADLYDTSGKKQQTETNRFITDLQKQSDKYFNGTQAIPGAKQDLVDLAHLQDIASLEAKNKINKITEEALAYANYCHETDLAVKGSQLSSNNKEEINKRCLSIAEKSRPFVEAIAKLKTHSNSLENIRTGAPHLKQINVILADVGTRLFNNKPILTAEDITYAEVQVKAFEGHVEALKKMRDSKKDVVQINQDLQRIASISEKLCSAGQNEKLLSELKVDLLRYWNDIKKNNMEITEANLKKREFVDEQKRLLQQRSQGLNETLNLINGLGDIIYQMNNIATILVDLSRANATKVLQAELIQPNSLFNQIVYDKKQHLGKIFKNALLDEKVASLKQKLLRSVPSRFLTQLLEQLKIIHEAPLETQVTEAQSRFLELLSQSVDKAANPSMAEERLKYYSSLNKINEATRETRLLDPANMETAKTGIRKATALASRQLETLAAWEKEEIKPVSYINFQLLDMKGPRDFTSGLIYGRVKEHWNGFLDFLKRDDTYRYGLLHHLFLIPYIEAIKGSKKG